VGVALGFIITIWLFPYILLPEQYGLTRVLLSLATVSAQLADLGTENTIIRYFPIFRDKDNKHHGSLFLALGIPFVGFLLVSLGLYIFQPQVIQYFIDRSPLLVDYYWLILPLAFFTLFYHVLSSYVRALYDTVMASFLMNIITRILTIIILVLYFFGWLDFEQFMVAFVCIYGIIVLWLLKYLFQQFEVNLKPDFDFLRKSLLKSMANYSGFAFFGGIASIIVNNIDIIMLSALAGLSETGIYAIAFYVGSAITIPRKSIFQIASPVISDAFKDKDFDLIEKLYHRSSVNLLIGGGLVFCGVVANIDNLMSLLPPDYAGGAMVIIVIASANVFDMTCGLKGAIILNSKLYRFDLYSTFILIIVTILLNYWLIPIYGILGAAIGTATAIVLNNLLKILYIWIKFAMQPFELRLLSILAVGGVTLGIVFQIPTLFNTYADILIRSLIVCGLYLVPIIYFKISEQFNKLVIDSLQSATALFKR
jgi:O-antigen/teichoic acid export membrane protein